MNIIPFIQYIRLTESRNAKLRQVIKQKFLQQNIPAEEIDDVLNKFQIIQSYFKKNKQEIDVKHGLKTYERTLDFWAGKSSRWKLFKDKINNEFTYTQLNMFNTKDNEIIVRDDTDDLIARKWLIIIPLNHRTSCYRGSDTDWCTTKQHQSQFSEYFIQNDITLVYCIEKKTKNKWAMAVHLDVIDNTEFFNKHDKRFTKNDFEKETGLSADSLIQFIQEHETEIQAGREESAKTDLGVLVNKIDKPDKTIERMILQQKAGGYAVKYLERLENKIHKFPAIEGFEEKAIPIIASQPDWAYMYALSVRGGPFKLGEPAIAKSLEYSYKYATDVLDGPFKLGEPAIAEDATYSYGYARDVLGGPFKLGEPAIAKSAAYSYMYASNVLGGPFKLGEPAIAKSADWYSHKYNEFLDSLK